jgi:hypothetical protein
MGYTIISYPDRTLTATLTGSGWTNLDNLKNPQLSAVTRSADVTGTKTIYADLGSALPIQAISVCAHNLTKDAAITIRGYSDSGYTTMVTGADTGSALAWPSGFTTQNVTDYPKNWTYCFSSSKTARYWKIEITDTTNAAGYIELGRLWLGEATFNPSLGISYGLSLGYESRDVITESLGGVPWGEQRTPRRSLTATFDTLTATEKRKALIMQKVLTETSEALFVTDVTAGPEDMLLEAFLCYFRKPSALQYPYFDNNTLPLQIIERL